MICAEKKRYPSKRFADEAKKKRIRENPTLELRSYFCPACGKWHLTHQVQEEEAA